MSICKLQGHLITFQRFEKKYLDNLLNYLNALSSESKSRFGPHPFTSEAVTKLFEDSENFILYLAVIKESDKIVAYTIVKKGWLPFDAPRLNSYNLFPSIKDCTMAPSVTDNWQSRSLGSNFFQYVANQLKTAEKLERIILWGGVQSTNNKAIIFYKKLGFRVLREFTHNGNNFDMALDLDHFKT